MPRRSPIRLLRELKRRRLARVPDLRVPARTGSFAFRGRKEDVRQIAEERGVRTVLEGSARKAGEGRVWS